MKLCFVAILGFLLVFSVVSQAEVLFFDNLNDNALSAQWKVVTGDFTENNGVVTMSQGEGQYPSLAVNQQIDFSGGVTFQAVLNKGETNDIVMVVSPTDASELPRKIPWDGPFIRIVLDNGTGHPIIQSTPAGNGVEVTLLADLPVIDWDDEAFQWAMYIEGDALKVYQDGVKVFDGTNTGAFTKGYLTFGGSQAVNTTIDDVVIYSGDYDPDILNKATTSAVNSAEKLMTYWGEIKAMYR